MSGEERAENLAKSIAVGAMNPYYVKWDAIVKHAADVLHAERLAALEEAMDDTFALAKACESRSPEGVVVALMQRRLEARIRALKGEK